jgi:2-methylcitrate dehydratase PrpD
VTLIESLAGFVHDFDLDALTSETVDRLELHLLDTLAALSAGWELEESRAIRKLAGPSEALTLVAAARATEMDDIHLRSCTTPGSVVVGTALSLVAERVITTPRDLLSTLAVGYELMIRLGLAIDGPKVLGKGVWPTLFAAPLGSGAVAARAFGLSVEQTTGAFATALALTAGTPIRPLPSTSRWLTLGAASRNGILAARGASCGLLGSDPGFRIAGVEIVPQATLADLGENFLIDELCLKPYPIARQALAAVEACRELGAIHAIHSNAIEEIVVEVPEQQAWVIDRPDAPQTRMASIVSVPYLAAVTIVAPEKLHDVRRTPPFIDDEVRELMTRVRVESSSRLARHYPSAWPARVTVRSGSETHEREMLHPRGDVESDFGWDEVIEKLVATGANEEDESERRALADRIRSLHEASELPSFRLGSRDVEPIG